MLPVVTLTLAKCITSEKPTISFQKCRCFGNWKCKAKDGSI